LRKDLTGEYARLNQKPRRLGDIARDYLNEEQIKILRDAIKDEEAIENGERPAPNEKSSLRLMKREATHS